MAVTSKFVCSGCRWWHFHPTEGAEPDSEQAVGYCRRFPPARRENGVGAWPITFGNDWCGEYGRRAKSRGSCRAALPPRIDSRREAQRPVYSLKAASRHDKGAIQRQLDLLQN